ncbi:hypothetical protein PLICRDRAFT_41438 [Plicaturopsis crispa FD-325 SS-3]|nr:hypothetical protein PLICRDRAFT_41438 [Plicaturopsis crispa FD-325 SS-3]
MAELDIVVATLQADVSEKDRELADDTKSAVTVAVESEESDFPDGGLRAWLVVFGTVCTNIATFGYANSWGTFQSYYEQTILQDSSPSDIAWIGSLQYALVFLPTVFVGRMFDIGYFKIPIFLASVILVVATFLVAECTQYWQFLLCQGIVTGLASGTVFGPSLAVISHWFKRRRGVALGVSAIGSSIGGTVIPIMANKLIKQVGFPWTMRYIGFLLIATLGAANLALKRRLPPVRAEGGFFNVAVFKSAPFTVYCLSTFCTFLGLYTTLIYMNADALFVGISSDYSFYLISIANASSALGRIAAGFLSDKIGPVNVMAPFTVIAGILTIIWPHATSVASLTIIAVLYGLSSGAYVSLLVAPVIALGDTSDVGRRLGMAMTFLAAGAITGPPISGAINSATGGFKAVGIYAGVVVFVAVGLMWLCRYLVLRRFWGKF